MSSNLKVLGATAVHPPIKPQPMLSLKRCILLVVLMLLSSALPLLMIVGLEGSAKTQQAFQSTYLPSIFKEHQAASSWQGFYPPLNESTVRDALLELDKCGDDAEEVISGTITILSSVSAASDNTTLFYQFLDDNSVTPMRVLAAGQVITESFTRPFRIRTDKPVAVSQVAWAEEPGIVLAGAVEVYDLDKWGSNYEIPIGPSVGNFNNFSSTFALVTAHMNNTNIYTDGNYVDVLQAGESILLTDFITVSTKITSTTDKPIQVHLITGNECNDFETRWFTLLPTSNWGYEYLNPIPSIEVSATKTVSTNVYLYNPNDTPMEIFIENEDGSSPLTIEAHQSLLYTMPTFATRFYASELAKETQQPFFALVAVDTKSEHDWGFSLIPKRLLASQAIVGLGVGNYPLSTDPNASPAWVAASCDGTFYVDRDSDGTPDSVDFGTGSVEDHKEVDKLETVRIFDGSDQSGLLIYFESENTSPDGCYISAAWGQDPSVVSITPTIGIDAGTGILPLPLTFAVTAEKELGDDLNNDNHLNIDDTILYVITIQNTSFLPIPKLQIKNILPQHVTYVTNTTTVNSEPIPDRSQDGMSDFPLEDDFYTIGTLSLNESKVISFEASVNDTSMVCGDNLQNVVLIQAAGQLVTRTVTFPPKCEPLLYLNTTVVEHTGNETCPGSSNTLTLQSSGKVTFCYELRNDGETFLQLNSIEEAYFENTPPVSGLQITDSSLIISETLEIFESITTTTTAIGNVVDIRGNILPNYLPLSASATTTIHINPPLTSTPTQTVTPTSTPTPESSVNLQGVVWVDDNQNSIYDGGEPVLSNIWVNLYSSSEEVLSNTVTNGLGQYSFSGLDTNQTYVVKLDYVADYQPPNSSNNFGGALHQKVLIELGDNELSASYGLDGYPFILSAPPHLNQQQLDFGFQNLDEACSSDVLNAHINPQPNHHSSIVTNIGVEPHLVGMAVYTKDPSDIDNIEKQILFDYTTAFVDANETVSLTITLPNQAMQIDLFCGPVIYSFEGGIRYGERLLDFLHIN